MMGRTARATRFALLGNLSGVLGIAAFLTLSVGAVALGFDTWWVGLMMAAAVFLGRFSAFAVVEDCSEPTTDANGGKR